MTTTGGLVVMVMSPDWSGLNFQPRVPWMVLQAQCWAWTHSPSWKCSIKSANCLLSYAQLLSPCNCITAQFKQQAQIIVIYLREERWHSRVWYEQAKCYVPGQPPSLSKAGLIQQQVSSQFYRTDTSHLIFCIVQPRSQTTVCLH